MASRGSRSIADAAGGGSRLENTGVFWGVVGAEVVLALVTGLLAIGHAPFWHDEVASVSISDRGFGGIFQVLGHTDANMGLYYLGLHVWMWGGNSEGWVRALSALCFAGTVPAVALAGRRLFGSATGLLAGLAFTGSSAVVLYAQDARGYAAALLFATWASVLFLRCVEPEPPTARTLAGWVALSVLAIYANLFSGLVIGAQLASLAFHPDRRWLLRRLPGPVIAIVLVCLPLAVFLAVSASDQVSWIAQPSPGALWGTAKEFLGHQDLPLTFVAGALASVGALSAWRGNRDDGEADAMRRWRFAFTLGSVLFPPLILFVVSRVSTSYYIDRYLIALCPAVMFLVALGVVEIARRSRAVAIAAVLLLALLALHTRVDLTQDGDENLRAAAATIRDGAHPGDGIAFVPAFSRVGLDWYLGRTNGPNPLPEDFAVAPGGSARDVGNLYPREVGAQSIPALMASHDRIWVVGYPDSTWHPTPEPFTEGGLETLEDRYRKVEEQDFGTLRITLYQRDT